MISKDFYFIPIIEDYDPLIVNPNGTVTPVTLESFINELIGAVILTVILSILLVIILYLHSFFLKKCK